MLMHVEEKNKILNPSQMKEKKKEKKSKKQKHPEFLHTLAW